MWFLCVYRVSQKKLQPDFPVDNFQSTVQAQSIISCNENYYLSNISDETPSDLVYAQRKWIFVKQGTGPFVPSFAIRSNGF